MQAVNFRETLKCIAKTVVGLDVSLDHPPHVGYKHDWFAACLIQKVIRGKIYRRRTAERLGRPVSVGVVQVRRRTRQRCAWPSCVCDTWMEGASLACSVLHTILFVCQ